MTYKMVQNLVTNCPYHLEWLTRCNWINNDISMDSNEMLGIQDTIFVLWEKFWFSSSIFVSWRIRVFYLSCSVDNLSCIILAIVLDNSAESILNCRVIAVDEVVFNKTDRERWFAWATEMLDFLPTTMSKLNEFVPTERLPTIAIFLCFGAAGILLMQCDDSGRNH